MNRFKLSPLESLCLVVVVINIVLLVVFGFTFGVFTVILISTGILVLFIMNRWVHHHKWIKYIHRSLLVGMIGWAISFALVVGLILSAVTYEAKENDYDYVIVLGAGLWGERISLILEKRLEVAVELAEAMPDVQFILSGGKGEDEDLSEAEAMKRYMVAHGVEENRIILEDKSTSTSENLDYSKVILDNRGGGELLLLTSDFHLYRALELAKKKGLTTDGIASNTPPSVYMNYLTREYFAVLKSMVFD